ncbi:hypothetical protein CNR22_19645 [Sphingobacteriaceae bacterium]|nr:hypothetical protein CNR22_19645 [Sphingobacteriaceae bacterium]
MLATAKNIDVFCLQMKNHFEELDHPLQKEVSGLLDSIKRIVGSSSPIKKHVISALPQIFNLRIKGMIWLIEEGELDFSNIIDEVYPQIEKLKNNPRLEILAENILFALRCNKKVVEKLSTIEGFSEESVGKSVSQLSSITYEQFVTGIALSIPDAEATQKFLDWINSSLFIEFVATAAVIIDEENVQASPENINELAFLISDAAQEYIALATELGLLKTESTPNSRSQLNFDSTFVLQQKAIADEGFNAQDWPAA